MLPDGMTPVTQLPAEGAAGLLMAVPADRHDGQLTRALVRLFR
jgi:hypothetical protein